jgi:hypothetical protein
VFNAGTQYRSFAILGLKRKFSQKYETENIRFNITILHRLSSVEKASLADKVMDPDSAGVSEYGFNRVIRSGSRFESGSRVRNRRKRGKNSF